MTAHPFRADHALVPLGERVRWLRAFRLAACAFAALAWVVLPELARTRPETLAAGTGTYLMLTFAGEALWRFGGRRGLPLFGLLLILDGLYLGWLAYCVADPSGPLRYLIVVHLVTVTLLASFRTGLKLALWHSLLLLTFFHAQEAGLLKFAGVVDPEHGGLEYRSLAVTVAVFWLAGVATAAFAALNERELRRRRFDLEALAALATRLEHSSDERDVGRALVDAAADAFGFDRVLLFAMREEETVLLHAVGAVAAPGRVSIAPGRLLQHACAADDTVLVSRFAAEDDPELAAFVPESVNLVLVPLHAESTTVGILVCEHGLRRGSRIEQRVVSMLERFASQSALALRNAWLVDRLRRFAATDGLTGVPNRRAFDDVLGRELARAARSGEAVSVVMTDIDRFKLLNDTHGHLTGDAVLRRVARTLEETVRTGDVVARYGGEEFGIVLPGADRAEAFEVAERMRHAVAACDTDVPVTASFGVATYPDDAVDPTSIVSAADAALYESKRAGRNRVTAGDAAPL